METLKELCTILDEFGLPYFRQGSAPEELPDLFFTYWQVQASPIRSYDDDYHGERDLYSLVVYSKDPSRMDSLDNLAKVLKAKGWEWAGLPTDIPAWNEYCARAMKAERRINL